MMTGARIAVTSPLSAIPGKPARRRVHLESPGCPDAMAGDARGETARRAVLQPGAFISGVTAREGARRQTDDRPGDWQAKPASERFPDRLECQQGGNGDQRE
jgi:hypothetical protein